MTRRSPSRQTAPAAIADRLVASTAIHGQKLTIDEAQTRLREGKLDAIVWVEGTTVHVETEGSDPIRNGSTVGAIQRALAEALGSLGPAAPKIELSQLYGGTDYTFLDYLAPVFVAFFAFFFIFLLSAALLPPRADEWNPRASSGPHRFVVASSSSPTSRLQRLRLISSVVIIAFTVFVLKVQYRGNLATIFLVEAVMVVGAVSLGLLVSAAARNELQAVQFVPLVLLPQVFLSGFLVSLDQLPSLLRPISYVLLVDLRERGTAGGDD